MGHKTHVDEGALNNESKTELNSITLEENLQKAAIDLKLRQLFTFQQNNYYP